MASPQLENGYTQIANEILERLASAHLSPNEWQVVLCIIRKTYGFHKKVDHIANFQIGEMTGLRKDVVSRILKRLCGKGLIVRNGRKIGFQKDWELWKLPEQPTNVKVTEQSTKVDQLADKSWLNSPPQKIKEPIKEKGRKQVSSSPKENEQVKELFTALKERRGYENPNSSAEAKAMRWMLRNDYTLEEILVCYDYLKAQPFWKDKPLPMMSVQKQIGEWLKNRDSKQESEEWKMR